MLHHTYITYRLHRLQSRAFRLTETPFDVRSPEFVITPTEIFYTVAGSISPLIRTGPSIVLHLPWGSQDQRFFRYYIRPNK